MVLQDSTPETELFRILFNLQAVGRRGNYAGPPCAAVDSRCRLKGTNPNCKCRRRRRHGCSHAFLSCPSVRPPERASSLSAAARVRVAPPLSAPCGFWPLNQAFHSTCEAPVSPSPFPQSRSELQWECGEGIGVSHEVKLRRINFESNWARVLLLH